MTLTRLAIFCVVPDFLPYVLRWLLLLKHFFFFHKRYPVRSSSRKTCWTFLFSGASAVCQTLKFSCSLQCCKLVDMQWVGSRLRPPPFIFSSFFHKQWRLVKRKDSESQLVNGGSFLPSSLEKLALFSKDARHWKYWAGCNPRIHPPVCLFWWPITLPSASL